MGVCALDELTDALANTVHLGVGGPHEGRHRGLGLEAVVLLVIWHFTPIDTSHVFAPAEDLAHESLHGVDRRLPLLVSLQDSRDGISWIEQVQVE